MRRIGILDTTLGHGSQCLWAARMATVHSVPVADRLERCGFVGAEVIGMAHFNAAVRVLKEDPFERLRLLGSAMPTTPLRGFLRGRCLQSFRPLPDDINELFVERMVANGIRRISGFDGLHDWSNIVSALRAAERHGVYATVWLHYSVAPGYGDDYYVAKAREIQAVLAPDAIGIDDPGGLLTPDRVRTLVPAVRSEVGDTTVEFRTQCVTGLGPLVTLEAARAGADVVTTSIAPLADGEAPPSAQTIVANLRADDFECRVELGAVEEISERLRRVAHRVGLPQGIPAEYDSYQYEHQLVGSMLSTLDSELRAVGAQHRLAEVLEECARVREDLGWPIVVEPFARLVATQAMMNVLQGERYRVVPDEVKMFALGYFGRLHAPVKPEALDRIVESGARRIALRPPALEPIVPRLRKRFPRLSDDELLLRYLYSDEELDGLLPVQRHTDALSVEHPVLEMLRRLEPMRDSRVHLEGPDYRLRIVAGSGPPAAPNGRDAPPPASPRAHPEEAESW